MASFTDQLSDPNAGRRPVSPAMPKGGFLSSLGSSVGKVFDYMEARDQAKGEEALDEAAQAMVDFYANPVRETVVTESVSVPGAVGASGVDGEMPTVPGDIVRGADQVATLQRAVTQGRLSPTGMTAKAEGIINDLFRRFPDQKAEILTYMKAAGFQNFLTREHDIALGRERAEVDGDIAIRRGFAEAAAATGFYSPDEDEMVRVGREVTMANAAAAAARQRWEDELRLKQEGRAQSAEDRAALDARRKDAERAFVTSAGTRIDSYMGPLLQQMYPLMQAAERGDPGAQEALVTMVDKLRIFGENIKTTESARLRAYGGPEAEAAIDALIKQVDGKIKPLIEITTGETSSYAQTARTLKFLQDQLGVNAARALPLYTSLRQVFGANILNQMVGADGTGGLPAPVIQSLQAELKGFTGDFNSVEGQRTLRNVADILKGQLKLSQMPEEQAVKTMPVIYAASRAGAKAINADTATPDEIEVFSRAQGELQGAAIELQPGRMPLNSYEAAVVGVAGSEARAAMERVQKVDKERGDRLIAGSRLAATNLLNVGRSTIANVRGDQGITYIKFDEKQGRYVIDVDTAAYNEFAVKVGWATPIRDNAGRVTGYRWNGTGKTRAQLLAAPSKDLVRQLNSMNVALDHLVRTSPSDGNLPKGATPRELATIYATGRVPSRLVPKGADGKPAPAAQQWDDAIEAMNIEIDKQTLRLSTDPLTEIGGASPGFEGWAKFFQDSENNPTIIKDVDGADVRWGINGRAHPDVDLENLTMEDANKILKRDYWDAIGADQLDPALAVVASDAAAVAGTARAKAWIKESGGDLEKFIALQEAHYRRLAASEERYARRLNGWLKRLERARAYGLRVKAES